MSSRCLRGVVISLLAAATSGSATGRELRVCADPDNLPYSHQNGSGFENKLMELLARELDAEITFAWVHQWRGFIRKTLQERICDVVPGMAVGDERVRLTRPYYTSSYAFVTRKDSAPVASFSDLTEGMTIGVQLVGDDGTNTPPVEELAARGLNTRVKGFMVWGLSPARGTPLEGIMTAVADGSVDVAVVWGPQAGYFAEREKAPLSVAIVPPTEKTVQPMRFQIAMGVRKDDTALAHELDVAISKLKPQIQALLDSYGVPRTEGKK